MPVKAALTFETPVGAMTLVEQDGALIRTDFHSPLPPDAEAVETPLLAQAHQQLKEYFAGTRQSFDLPLAPVGTPFQRRCWDALCAIPYGETLTYGEEAVKIGNPKACRAVGMANHYNPLSVLIPCHRVIGKNGALVGYGNGLPVKRWLLDMERNMKGQK